MSNDKRNKRIFIVKIRVLNNCWHYKENDLLYVPFISNNINNTFSSFLTEYNGSEYPLYSVLEIIDTFDYGFFKPNINLITKR